jgi:hypothetical protein
MIKVYIDENLAPQIACGLNKLQEPLNNKEENSYTIYSISEKFGIGIKDEEWIPILGKEGSLVITKDFNIQKTRNQRELYEKYGLGVIFIKPPSGYKYWEYVQLIIKKWDDIKKIANKTERPFAYTCSPNSSKFNKIG